MAKQEDINKLLKSLEELQRTGYYDPNLSSNINESTRKSLEMMIEKSKQIFNDINSTERILKNTHTILLKFYTDYKEKGKLFKTNVERTFSEIENDLKTEKFSKKIDEINILLKRKAEAIKKELSDTNVNLIKSYDTFVQAMSLLGNDITKIKTRGDVNTFKTNMEGALKTVKGYLEISGKIIENFTKQEKMFDVKHRAGGGTTNIGKIVKSVFEKLDSTSGNIDEELKKYFNTFNLGRGTIDNMVNQIRQTGIFDTKQTEGMDIILNSILKIILSSFFKNINTERISKSVKNLISHETLIGGTAGFVKAVETQLSKEEKILAKEEKILAKEKEKQLREKLKNEKEEENRLNQERERVRGGSDKGDNLFFKGVAYRFILDQFPKLTDIGTMAMMVGKSFANTAKIWWKGIQQIMGPKMSSKIKNLFKNFEDGLTEKQKECVDKIKGSLNIIGSIFLDLGIVLAGAIMMAKYLFEKVSLLQRNILEAARSAGIETTYFTQFTRKSVEGSNFMPSVMDMFLMGGGVEKIFQSSAEYMSRMGGMKIYGQTSDEMKNMAIYSNLAQVDIKDMAVMKDLIENISGGQLGNTVLGTINKEGVIAVKILQDIAKYRNEFLLFGQQSFIAISTIANKVGMAVQSAFNLIEKFSTVSSAIDTGFKFSLVTGSFINPLDMFMKYAFGSPEDILKDITSKMGDVTNMNRIQKKFLADTLGVSISELETTASRTRRIEGIMTKEGKTWAEATQTFGERYKDPEELLKNAGVQRAIGYFNNFFNFLEQTVFTKISNWITKFIDSRGGMEKFITSLEKLANKISEQASPLIEKFVEFLEKNLDSLLKAIKVLTSMVLWAASKLPDIIDAMIMGKLGGLAGTLIGSAFDAPILGSAIGTALGSGIGYYGVGPSNFVDDAIITKDGSIVKTNPNDNIILAQSNKGLLNNALRTVINENNRNSITTSNVNTDKKIEILNVETDVKLDGYKIGTAITEIAVSY